MINIITTVNSNKVEFHYDEFSIQERDAMRKELQGRGVPHEDKSSHNYIVVEADMYSPVLSVIAFIAGRKIDNQLREYKQRT